MSFSNWDSYPTKGLYSVAVEGKICRQDAQLIALVCQLLSGEANPGVPQGKVMAKARSLQSCRACLGVVLGQ